LKLQSTILTFVLCLRLTSSVATFIGFEQAGTFEQNVASAVKYCTKAGLSRQLSEELKNADIFRQYELLIHLQPWKRHPATLTLKKIYALLMVLFFSSAGCALNQTIILPGQWISQHQ